MPAWLVTSITGMARRLAREMISAPPGISITSAGRQRYPGSSTMTPSRSRNRLGAPHGQAVVGFRAHVLLGGRRPETWPAAPGLEFLAAREQGVAAARAAVYTGSMIVPVAAGEGGFGALLARHGKLFRREFFLPFGIGLDDFVHLDGLPSLPILAE